MFDCMCLSVSVYECVGGCMLYDACVHVGVCKVCVCVYVSVHQGVSCVSVCVYLVRESVVGDELVQVS